MTFGELTTRVEQNVQNTAITSLIEDWINEVTLELATEYFKPSLLATGSVTITAGETETISMRDGNK